MTLSSLGIRGATNLKVQKKREQEDSIYEWPHSINKGHLPRVNLINFLTKFLRNFSFTGLLKTTESRQHYCWEISTLSNRILSGDLLMDKIELYK